MFIVRVELHSGGDYNVLHKEMARLGFSRTIMINQKEYHLPTGEYAYFKTSTHGQVLQWAATAARATGRAASILSTEGTVQSMGLVPV